MTTATGKTWNGVATTAVEPRYNVRYSPSKKFRLSPVGNLKLEQTG